MTTDRLTELAEAAAYAICNGEPKGTNDPTDPGGVPSRYQRMIASTLRPFLEGAVKEVKGLPLPTALCIIDEKMGTFTPPHRLEWHGRVYGELKFLRRVMEENAR